MSVVNVPVAQIKLLPAFLGEVDLMKSLSQVGFTGKGIGFLFRTDSAHDEHVLRVQFKL